MTPSLSDFSRTLTAHGLAPGGQLAVVVLACLWVVLIAFKPKRRGASWLSVMPALGPAERQALNEIALMVAVVCLTILAALGLSFIIGTLGRSLRRAHQWRRFRMWRESQRRPLKGIKP